MRGWSAVLDKELKNFFVSPIAYAVIGSFVLIAGFFFWANVSVMSQFSLQAASSPIYAQRINPTDMVVRPLIQNMSIILLFLMPLITMRLFSEEKKSGTIELLLTYPLTDGSVMAGKFLGATGMLFVMLLGTAPCLAILFNLMSVDLGPLIGGYAGLLLMGMAFLSLGMFISSLTENQIVAAAATFGAALMCWIMSWSSAFVSERVGAVIRQFSMLEHLEPFHKGIISLSDVSFFVLFTAFFLFLTLRSLEAHRWRG